MKLTNSDRDAFVAACIDDVPQINYNQLVTDKLMAWAKSIMPPAVRATYDLDPSWIEKNYVYVPGGLRNLYLPTLTGGHVIRDNYPELWAELGEIDAAHCSQADKLVDLRSKLASAITACSTLKQAKERLPEFEKYLPADRDGKFISTLPVANLVADLLAAGWPKDQPIAQGA